MGLLDVDRHHRGAVAGEHLGDRRADPAGRSGDDGDLAGQWPVPVCGAGGVGRTDVEHLTVDVGGLGREDEAHGRLQPGGRRFGLRREVHQGDGGAAAQFLGQRAGETLQGALGDVLVGAGGLLRGGADDDDPRAGRQIAQQRCEELVESPQPGRLGDAGGVEHQAAERVRPASPDVVGHHVVILGQRGPQRLDDSAFPADQQRARQRRFTRPVAAQRLGLRHAELLGQKRSRCRVDDLGEQVGSHC